ncbi:leucine-rich repeat and coiled-coil domain-containing 1 isoform X1 [Brachionus plicatilis]|uniref:Leucine-rich repeat and coiled-coil domain-containing 1 isoform X1 n=1 Tax=Brachionus plicatilis TaxID=10195 RepID=A0A3M7R571_BRAPC|nr:leucine-rich repeat and coiled-coil domain-containing 1 isoform X1 [Brachionus plicatilis]
MDEEDTDLSMIDCGIKSIKDLNLRYNLKSINLHSNLINKIENLTYLQNLIHLDLSSNKITKITRLHGLVSLQTLNLSCNQIGTIENLDGLKKLEFLNLSYNKIQSITGLSDLWGSDYSLETLLLNSNYILSLEELSYYLNGLNYLKHTALNNNKFSQDHRPFLFKNLKHLLSIDGRDRQNKTVSYKINKKIDKCPNFIENSPVLNTQDSEENVSVTLFGPKLDQIEEKIHKLLYIRDKIKCNNNELPKPLGFPRQTGGQVSKIDQSTSTIDSSFNETNSLNDLIKNLNCEIENYKSQNDKNILLITDLGRKVESVEKEKEAKCAEVVAERKKTEHLESKFRDLEHKLDKMENDCKEKFGKREEKMRKNFKNEIKVLKERLEGLIRQKSDKILRLEEEYKSLEDEFRQALVIESTRFNDLFKKYECNLEELSNLRVDSKHYDAERSRDKALINELNDLIREQKARVQQLNKLRQQNTDEIQKRSEKLNEAVTDLAKMKEQNELLKKEKLVCENIQKKLATEFDAIKSERTQWSTKLNEQKNFYLNEVNRLDTENNQLKSDLNYQTNCLNKEIDNCKIKSKIIEDQTETIKKLKQALVERDDLLKATREESLHHQKQLEKQLNDEMDLCNELQVKLEKSNEKKEALKMEVEDMRLDLAENKRIYDELAEKWKQKSESINELDVKVRRMKENFEMKEKQLNEMTGKLKEENEALNLRLRKADDTFRLQYDAEKKEHLIQIEKVRAENKELVKSYEARIKDLEDEMRCILVECENKKKFYDDKINSFTQVFSKFQSDLKSNF